MRALNRTRTSVMSFPRPTSDSTRQHPRLRGGSGPWRHRHRLRPSPCPLIRSFKIVAKFGPHRSSARDRSRASSTHQQAGVSARARPVIPPHAMSPILAEFIGTAILIVLGDGVVANVVLHQTKGHNSGWIVITAGWAFAVTIAVYCVGSISGAHLNPAVTIGLASIGTFEWAKVPMYIVAQLAGGLVGGIVVWLVYLPHW